MRTNWIHKLGAAAIMTVAAIIATPNTALADILGCEVKVTQLGNLVSCIQRKLDERIGQVRDEATKEMNRRLDEAKQTAEAQIAELNRRLEDAKQAAEAGVVQIGSDAEQEIRKSLRDLGLDKLHACLPGASNKSRTRIKDTVASMAKDPAGWARATMQDAWALVMSDANTLVGDDLALLRRSSTPPTDTDAIIDAAWAKFERVGSRHEGVGCLVTYLRPHVPAMKAQAVIAARVAQAKAKEVWETKIRPAIYDAIAAAVAAGIGAAAGPEAKYLVKAVVADRLLAPESMQETVRNIEALALAPTDPAKLAAVRASIDNRRTGMDPELALEIARVLGHAYIHNNKEPGGGWLIDKGLAAVAQLKDLAAESAESACGLAPEAGAFACAFVIYAAEAAIVVETSPAAKVAMVIALDAMLDDGIMLSLDALRSPKAVAALRDAKTRLGPFAKIMDAETQRLMTAFVERYVVNTATALDAYNQSVKNLATAAAKR